MRCIERHRRESRAGVGLPLVDATVAVGVLLGGDQDVVGVVLRSRNFTVAPRRDFGAFDLAVGTGKRPRVFLAVVRTREADLLQLLAITVVLPPVDGAVL